jgi:DMSO/TMAO reductase YedYZ heme-binding membrane subunit
VLRRWTEGYRLTLWLVVSVGLATGLASLGSGIDEQALRRATRWTVDVGTVFFTAAFVASAANTLLHATWTKWLLRNRRYLGLTFAGIHFLHAGAFLTLAAMYPESFWRRIALTTLVGGTVGYLWLIAMTITSFDGPTRALGKIGKRAWKVLHKSGMYVLWGILVFSYVFKVFRAPAYGLLVSLLLTAFVVRILASARRGLRAAKANAK